MKKILLLICFISFPAICSAQFQEAYKEMVSTETADFEKYQDLVLEATNYIFNNPVDQGSAEFVFATQIVGYWMDKDTGINIPTFGAFFTSLTNENHQQFLYTIAMINYSLDQKINHQRLLTLKKQKRKKFHEQEDVREVQIEGAKILLEYMSNESNNLPVPPEAEKYLEAYKNNQLESIFLS